MTATTRAKKSKKHAVLAARHKKPKHGESMHAGRKAAVVQEESATKPSRKSTRKASNRSKTTTNLQLRAQRAVRAPKRRAAAAATKARKAK